MLSLICFLDALHPLHNFLCGLCISPRPPRHVYTCEVSDICFCFSYHNSSLDCDIHDTTRSDEVSVFVCSNLKFNIILTRVVPYQGPSLLTPITRQIEFVFFSCYRLKSFFQDLCVLLSVACWYVMFLYSYNRRSSVSDSCAQR